MKGMKESYIEELATHCGPESCVPVREDRRAPVGCAGIEALTGGNMGRVLSRDIGYIEEADVLLSAEERDSAVARDVAAVKCGRERTAVWRLGLKARLGTLCHRKRRALGDVVSSFIPPLLGVPALRSSVLVTDAG